MHKLHDKALEVLSRLGVASEETLESSVITERVTEAGIKEETDRAREIIEAFTERGHVTASTEPEEMDLVGITHILPAYETHEMPDFENDFVGVYHEIPLHTAEIQCSAETKFNPFAAMFGKKNNHLDSGTMAEIPAFTKRRGTYSRVGDIHGNDVTAGNVDPILVEPVDFRRPSLTNDVADLPLGKLNTLGDNPYRFLSNRRDRWVIMVSISLRIDLRQFSLMGYYRRFTDGNALGIKTRLHWEVLCIHVPKFFEFLQCMEEMIIPMETLLLSVTYAAVWATQNTGYAF